MKNKVLIVNTYCLNKIHLNWRAGINPSHFLMGFIELSTIYNFSIDILEHEKYPFLNKIGELMGISYLDQQIRTLFIANKYDVIYFPYPPTNTLLICVLKKLRLLKPKLIVLIHQNFFHKKDSYFYNKTIKMIYSQYDFFAFFSRRLKQEFNNEFCFSQFISNNKFHLVNWGPDISFYQRNLPNKAYNEEPFAVCAGTINRDFDLIISVFNQLNFKLNLFCTPDTSINRKKANSNIHIDSSWVSYLDLLNFYHRSKFIIVPLRQNEIGKGRTQGLTVLLDALAVGKPIIMTYNPYIDLDIEKENIGIWVKSNSPDEWVSKLSKLINLSTEHTKVMEDNLKSLCVRRYNIDIFGSQMNSIFKKAINN